MYDFFAKTTNIHEILRGDIHIPEEILECMPKYSNKEFTLAYFGREQEPHGILKELRLKELYKHIGMFGYVSWKWINPLTEWIGARKCLEVMAGRGWLSYALQQKGVEIIATDDYSWHNSLFKNWKETVTQVEDLDALSSIEKYGSSIDILFISWPFTDDTAYQTIQKLHEVNNDALVVYIGEGPGGETADLHFFKNFEVIDDPLFHQISSNYESWYSINDRMFLGKFRQGAGSLLSRE